MKSRRLQFGYRRSASSFHRIIGDLLRQSPLFKGHRLFQEYPVYLINSNFKSKREKFDWIILDLKTVIEVHGQFHYQPVPWLPPSMAQQLLEKQQTRDAAKKQAAIDANWCYIAINYQEIPDINDEEIFRQISESIRQRDCQTSQKLYGEEEQPGIPYTDAKTNRTSSNNSFAWKERMKALSSQARKTAYQKFKEYKKNANKYR